MATIPQILQTILDKLDDLETKIEADKKTYAVCHHCEGSGEANDGTNSYPCSNCGGTGYIATGKIAKD